MGVLDEAVGQFGLCDIVRWVLGQADGPGEQLISWGVGMRTVLEVCPQASATFAVGPACADVVRDGGGV